MTTAPTENNLFPAAGLAVGERQAAPAGSSMGRTAVPGCGAGIQRRWLAACQVDSTQGDCWESLWLWQAPGPRGH